MWSKYGFTNAISPYHLVILTLVYLPTHAAQLVPPQSVLVSSWFFIASWQVSSEIWSLFFSGRLQFETEYCWKTINYLKHECSTKYYLWYLGKFREPYRSAVRQHSLLASCTFYLSMRQKEVIITLLWIFLLDSFYNEVLNKPKYITYCYMLFQTIQMHSCISVCHWLYRMFLHFGTLYSNMYLSE